jgi:hypothetical protein
MRVSVCVHVRVVPSPPISLVVVGRSTYHLRESAQESGKNITQKACFAFAAELVFGMLLLPGMGAEFCVPVNEHGE